MSTLYTLNSDQTPALDGYVNLSGAFVPSGVTLRLEKSGSSATRVWLRFPEVMLTKYHKMASAQLRLTAAENSDPLSLRVRAVALAEPPVPDSVADLEDLPLTDGVDTPRRMTSSGEVLALELRHVINELLEQFPPDSQPRPLMLVLDFSVGATNAVAEFHSGEAVSNRPTLTIAEESVLNVWRGDAPNVATSFRVRILDPVFAGTEYLLRLEHTRRLEASYVAQSGDSPALVAAGLAGAVELVDPGTTEYTDGTESFVYTSPMLGAETLYEVTAASSKVERVQAGALAVTQIVEVTLDAATTGGTWTLTCDWGSGNETTAPIAWNASAADVRSALEALATPAPGDVLVSKIGTFRWRIEFSGALTGQNATVTLDHSGLTFTRATLTRIQDADPDGDVTNIYIWHFTPISESIYVPNVAFSDVALNRFQPWRFRFGTGPWSPQAFLVNLGDGVSQGDDGTPTAYDSVLNVYGSLSDILLYQLRALLPPEDAAKVNAVGDKGFRLDSGGNEYSQQIQVYPAVVVTIPQSVIDTHGELIVSGLPVTPVLQTPRPVVFFSTLNYPSRLPPSGFLTELGGHGWHYVLTGTKGNDQDGFTNWTAGSIGGDEVQLSFPLYDHASEQWTGPLNYTTGGLGTTVVEHLRFSGPPVTDLFKTGPVYIGGMPGTKVNLHGRLFDSVSGIYPENPVAQLFHGTGRWLILWDGDLTPMTEDFKIDPVYVFPNTSAGRANPAGTGYRAKVAHLAGPVGPKNQIDRLSFIATGGTFTLTAEGDTTDPISYPPSAQAIDDAMAAAAGSDVLNVTPDGVNFRLEWVGTYATQEVDASVDGSSLTGIGGLLSSIRDGVPAVNEKQRITVDPTAFDGTLQFSDPLSSNRFSDPVDWNADVADLQAAADLLLGSASSLWTGFDDGGPWIVEFTGPAYGGRPLPLMKLRQRLRVTGAGVEVTELAAGSGPNHWAIPANWSLNRVPQTGDVAVLADGSADILFGLVQMAEFSATAGSPILRVSGGDFREGQLVRLRSTGTLPVPFQTGRDYIVTEWSRLFGLLKLTDALTGAVIVPVDSGVGTHELSVFLQQLHVRMPYRGGLGLPPRQQSGDVEIRQRHLRISFLLAHEFGVLIGLGTGPGFSRFHLDAGRSHLAVEAFQSGQGRGDQAAVQLLSTSGDLVLVNHGASVAIAQNPGEISRFLRLLLYGGSTKLGRQVAAERGATIVRHSGAELICEDCDLRNATLSLLE